VYNQTVSTKLSITPWDCDGTWGRKWDGTSNNTPASLDVDTYTIKSQNTLFKRLRLLNFEDYNSNITKRYEALRGTYFTYSSLLSRFQNYFDLFEKSGALDRETVLWPKEATIRGEISYLQSWIQGRLEYMDMKYLGKYYIATGTTNNKVNRIQFAPNPVRDILTISGLKSGEIVQLISIQGTVLIYLQSSTENLVINMSEYTEGVYLLKVGNTISKVIKN
jgi:hypothetical protein